MSGMKNMAVWDHARKTDPSATKENNQGGFKSTTINGYWMIEKATELWGPAGTAWGWEVIEERFDEGCPILDKETKMPLCKSIMHTIKLAVFYPGAAKPVIQYGHTPYVYNSKYGPITDMEAPKKSLMDAIKKCLSMLGFSADVFRGEFDDVSYVEELRNEEAIKKADDKDAERIKQELEYKEWAGNMLRLAQTAQSINELEKLYKTAAVKMKRRNDADGLKSMTLATTARKLELEQKENKQ